MKYLMTMLLLILGPAAFAAAIPEAGEEYPSFEAKISFGVDDYDKKAHAYELVLDPETAPGPFYASPEALAKAIPRLKLEKLLADPERIVGNGYIVPEGAELLLLTPEELKARRVQFRTPKP